MKTYQTRAPEYPGGENRRKLSIQMVSEKSDLKKARGLWKFVPTKNFRPIFASAWAAAAAEAACAAANEMLTKMVEEQRISSSLEVDNE